MKWHCPLIALAALGCAPALADPPPAPAARPATRPRVELFPSSALSPDSPSKGAVKSKAAPGPAINPAPPLSSTNVAPGWRDAESRISQLFKPTAAALADGPGVTAAGRQVANMKPGARPTDAMPNRTLDEELDAQVLTAQEAADAPAHWYDVEIASTIDERGKLVDARVVSSSGRPRLDALALEAVRAAVSSEPVVDPAGRSVARWHIATGRSVKLPRVNPLFAPGTRRVVGLSPQLPVRFDESSGSTKVVAPFTQDMKTRVKLISVTTQP